MKCIIECTSNRGHLSAWPYVSPVERLNDILTTLKEWIEIQDSPRLRFVPCESAMGWPLNRWQTVIIGDTN